MGRVEGVRSRIVRERGTGTTPTIVLSGFVPDSTEAVEFQRPLFRSFGNIYYVNYSRTGFAVDALFNELTGLIAHINARHQRPVVFSASFGCGVVAAFLREIGARARSAIKGIVMVSPVFCADDLVRPDGDRHHGVRLLEHTLKRIFTATAQSDINRQLARARRCFMNLFGTGCLARTLTSQHHAILAKITSALEETTVSAGYQRLLAFKQFRRPELTRPIFSGPALALLAEREGDVLVPTSPTLDALRDPAVLARLFPQGSLREVTSATEGDPVLHASLILHHHCYNPLIEAWYARLGDQPATAPHV